jgi:hypothetical protein
MHAVVSLSLVLPDVFRATTGWKPLRDNSLAPVLGRSRLDVARHPAHLASISSTVAPLTSLFFINRTVCRRLATPYPTYSARLQTAYPPKTLAPIRRPRPAVRFRRISECDRVGQLHREVADRELQRVGRIGVEGVIRRSWLQRRCTLSCFAACVASRVHDWSHPSFHPDARVGF